MEPQATYDFIKFLLNNGAPPLLTPTFDRTSAELGPRHPLHASSRMVAFQDQKINLPTSKLGQRILDERITIRSDPLNADLGTLPYVRDADNPLRPVTWIEHGILQTLPYNRRYALSRLMENEGFPYQSVFLMEGEDTSIDDMIATTKRGLLVTRFWELAVVDAPSLLLTGVTRDGLWLIENGKISKAVKNLRLTESPLFAFNQVDQLGTAVPVFSPEFPAVVPATKVRDFSFTALVDAV
jgi:predicted Zn-dependent protease